MSPVVKLPQKTTAASDYSLLLAYCHTRHHQSSPTHLQSTFLQLITN